MEVLTIRVHESSTHQQVGKVGIQLKDLKEKEEEEIENWFSLSVDLPLDASPRDLPITNPEIRLKLKYTEEIVFPAPIYDEMTNVTSI